MAALDTVEKLITDARVLLQDTVDSPYRYADADLLSALNEAFPEAKKLRPDLFLTGSMPEYTTVDGTAITVDPMYRVAFLYYVVGRAQMRDDEPSEDQRAAAFLGLFTAKLGGLS